MKEVNRPSVAISTVLRPTSFINGMAKDAKTSSASMITDNRLRLISQISIWIGTESKRVRGIRYLEKTELDLRFQLVECGLHLFVAAYHSSELWSELRRWRRLWWSPMAPHVLAGVTSHWNEFLKAFEFKQRFSFGPKFCFYETAVVLSCLKWERERPRPVYGSLRLQMYLRGLKNKELPSMNMLQS